MNNKLAFLLIAVLAGLSLLGFLNKSAISNKVLPVKLPLQGTVEQAMADSNGRYGIVVKNFKTGESYSSNEHQTFEAGSLYKLWVMATAFSKIKEGDIKIDELLSQDISALNAEFEIGPEDAELSGGEISMTVSQALNQMITISHNYAALLLTDRVKNSSLETFLNDYGFKESAIGSPPKTTPSDIALYLEKLYRGELIDKDSSQKMVELLKGQQLNDGLPKYLPDELGVAHKTGDIGWFKHDAGIVYSEKGDYLIVVLSESDYPSGAQERIASLSKAVFDYFNE